MTLPTEAPLEGTRVAHACSAGM